MKRPLIFVSVLMIFGCKQPETQTPSAVVEKTIADPVATIKPSRSLIDTFMVDAKRDTLFMQFDTVKGSAVMRYKGEPIVLQSQPTGSGIRYTNADFEYTEWQGESTLKNNGNIVFTNEK